MKHLVCSALTGLGLLGCANAEATQRASADILITNGTVITMDSGRRVLENGAVAIVGDRIVAVGSTADLSARFSPREVIDASRKIVMPGLIDGHGHAGHGLVKTLGTDTRQWNTATEKIYANGSTVDFWRADALLTSVERLRFGVTTSLTLFGGGDMVIRTDDQKYGDAYLQAVQDVGIRYFLAVGPRRPPFPRTFTEWNGNVSRDVPVTFERQLEVSEARLALLQARTNVAQAIADYYIADASYVRALGSPSRATPAPATPPSTVMPPATTPVTPPPTTPPAATGR